MQEDFEINMFLMRSLALRARNLACQVEDVSLRNIAQSISRILYALCCHEAEAKRVQQYFYQIISSRHSKYAGYSSGFRN